jgi:hypothetical protein
MKRLTSRTAGDATRKPHYIHGPGIKKDDLLQRLGLLEDRLGSENFWLICICAVRYALGRRTYIVHTVCRFLMPLIPEMPYKELKVIRRDIQEHGETGGKDAYGDECDYDDWMTLYTALEREVNRREGHAPD